MLFLNTIPNPLPISHIQITITGYNNQSRHSHNNQITGRDPETSQNLAYSETAFSYN